MGNEGKVEWNGEDLLALYNNCTEEIRSFKNQQWIIVGYGLALYGAIIHEYDVLNLGEICLHKTIVMLLAFIIALFGTGYIISFQKTMRENRECLENIRAKFSNDFRECGGSLPKNYTSISYFFFTFCSLQIAIFWLGFLVVSLHIFK